MYIFAYCFSFNFKFISKSVSEDVEYKNMISPNQNEFPTNKMFGPRMQISQRRM